MSINEINKKLDDFISGKMSEEQAAAFLHLAENDPFLSDAIDGFMQTNANPQDLSKIKNRIIKPYKRKYLKMTIGLSVAASLLLIAFYMAKDVSVGLSNSGKGIRQAHVFDLPILTPIDSLTLNDTALFIENETRHYTAEMRIVPQKITVPESIAPLNVIQIINVGYDSPNNEINHKYKYRSNHYYSYIGGLKVVDYRYDKRQNHDNLDIIDNSEKFVANNNVLIPETQMTYVDFLKSALVKYENANYIDAVCDFDIILEQFPDDANAIFYKALCFYEMGENDKALNMFERASNLKINTFSQESMWHTGLIFKEEKQYAAAEKVLQEIVNDEGYYGVQAKKELDELYKIYLNE